jgi:hypothetical protein
MQLQGLRVAIVTANDGDNLLVSGRNHKAVEQFADTLIHEIAALPAAR